MIDCTIAADKLICIENWHPIVTGLIMKNQRGFVQLSVLAAVCLGASAHAEIDQQLFRLTASDGVALDNFGWSVAMSGTTAVVSQHDPSENNGSAYIFDVTTGQELFKLLGDGGATASDAFGASVAISETMVVVGAFGDDTVAHNAGAVYAFDATTGQRLFKLFADDGATNAVFGISVAMNATTLVVGSSNETESGSAYIFDAITGQQLFKLLPSDGAVGDHFGQAVAIDGSIAIVGAPSHADNGRHHSGSAYVFDVTTGQQLFKLLPNDSSSGKLFGRSVAISGTTAVVGAPDNAFYYGNNFGAAYAFDVTTGQQLSKLVPDAGEPRVAFGLHVATSGTTAVISGRDDATGVGATYILDVATEQQIFKMVPNDRPFGLPSVGVSGATAITGAIRSGNEGATYIFNLSLAIPLSVIDLNGDGCVGAVDLAIMLGSWGPNSTSDLNCDGMTTSADLALLLGSWGTGCF